jgi:hypothetical protein
MVGQLNDILSQALFIGTTAWSLALGGAMLTKGATGPAFGYAGYLPYLVDALAPA